MKTNNDNYYFVSFSAQSDQVGEYSFDIMEEECKFRIHKENSWELYRFIVEGAGGNLEPRNLQFEGRPLSEPSVWIPGKPEITITDFKVISSQEMKEDAPKFRHLKPGV